MIAAVIMFIIMYICLLTMPNHRAEVALCAALVFVVSGILPISAIMTAINWNVIMMLAGTMGIVELFISSRMPLRLAEKLISAVPNVCWAVIVLSIFAGVVSAFVDNVATVLMIAPVGLEVSKKLKINPIPIIISIAVSSNLQGAATLVGDTTSILLGNYTGMSFTDFFWMNGRLGIAFAVEVGAMLTIPVLMWLFRKEKAPVQADVETEVTDYVPSVLLVGVVVMLIAASMFPNKPELTNGYICLGLAAIGTVYECLRNHSIQNAKLVFMAIDWRTLFLLIGLFLVIEGITYAGVIDAIAELFVKIGGSNEFLLYTLIVFVSVFLSAFIDNIPYVATMLPVITTLSAILGVEPYLLSFGLLIGATLGGNLTPVGASANIAGIGILQKAGYKVSTKDFLRIGIPFTLAAALGGYITLWLIWG